jgi:hypothetical protein
MRCRLVKERIEIYSWKLCWERKTFKRQIQKDTFPCLNKFQHGIVQVKPKTTTYDL